MKILEQFHSEEKRFIVFKILYGFLFFLLIGFLTNLQFLKNEEFRDKERIQGQRRILKPGARGDVFDRNQNLLIGNKAQFTAVLHLDHIKDEIWKKKISLKKISSKFREDLKKVEDLSIVNLLNACRGVDHIMRRGIKLRGNKTDKGKLTKIYINNERKDVNELNYGYWACNIQIKDSPLIQEIITENTGDLIEFSAAGLFKINFRKISNRNGNSFSPYNSNDIKNGFIESFFNTNKNDYKQINFSVNSFKIGWEARYSIVENYLNSINKITGRNLSLSIDQIIKHWNQMLVLPYELASDLTPREYALLIESIPTDSPLKIQSNSIRHYPFNSSASHILGYVGSGYQPQTENLNGNDLATFEIKGKKGKSGLEKFFDDHLRGKDGGDIWRINPIGLRFEQIEKKPSRKGKPLYLSIDIDLQKKTEMLLHKMSLKVQNHRILPDADWKKTIHKRTLNELLSKNENEISPELLLSSFKDAPFPLGASEASTVAGFKGTKADANQLLRLLYSKGVLERSQSEENKYFIAPPPPPPAAGVMIDVDSGEILTLASIPNYNLSELSPRISQNTYDKIERQEAWLPRAWHPGYSPASPFKLVTAVAALRNNVITPEKTLLCDGIYKGMICHCYPGKHGEINLRDAEAQSCNVYFFKLAELLGERELIKEAHAFGMDISPNIELPSLRNSPNVPDPTWKKQNVGEPWALEDTFNFAIGQGGLRQSPLQMACFAAALATKQKVFEPTLILGKKTSRKTTPIGLNEHKYNAIIDGMHLATLNGTAKRCQIKGINIAGKTGTAQWRNHNMKLSLAWFIGFAPVEKPKVAVAVLVEGVIPQDHIQGGLTAAPIAKQMLEEYFSNQKYTSEQLN